MLNKGDNQMKSSLRKLVLSGLLLLTPITMASCSFFNTSDAVINIKNIETKTDDKGNTVITIYYTDVNKDPTTFTIPKGNDGKEGVGIKNIEYNELEDESGTEVTINFTDETRDPVVFTILNGEGKKGDRGNGIDKIESTHDEENKQTVITITFTDSNYEPISLTIPDGKDGEKGKSITSVSQKDITSEGKPVIRVSFSNDDGEVVGSIDIPRTNNWLSGAGNPNELNVDGIDGDFYFDTANSKIYIYNNKTWQQVLDLGSAKKDLPTYKVSFEKNLNEDVSYISGYDQTYFEGVYEGYSFYSMDYNVPLPYASNYEFKGWMTKQKYDATVGIFTDLTPVYKDMKLYGYWVAKN